jgi:WD40 repeat protein
MQDKDTDHPTVPPACPCCAAPLPAGAPLGICRSCLAANWLALLDTETDNLPPPGESATEEFAGFLLREQLGRGGMGVVYRAWQPGLQREVALKLVSSGRFAGTEEFQRLRLEAEAAARLTHPGIVTVYEAGECDGQPWLAMQYVPGGSLSQHLGKSPAPFAWAARLVADVSRAVHYAHQHGVLHRDLKPGNILLSADGRPLVADFGLARFMEQEENLTLTGRSVGSPAYMSPESFKGDASTARDVYALGVILYQLLTGQLPFAGSDPAALVRHCTEDDPAPPRQLRRGLPRDLEVITLKCLEKLPARRYGSAAALADDLENWLSFRPIAARPSPPHLRMARWIRRRPAHAAAVAAACLAASGYATHLHRTNVIRAAAAAETASARASALANLQRASLESALRETEAGFLDQARRILTDVRTLDPAAADASPEWKWLWSRCTPQGLTLTQAHQGEITAAAFSPDGRTLATAGQDALIHLWNCRDLSKADALPIQTIRTAHRTAPIHLSFSPDGSRIFTARNGQPPVAEWIPRDDSPAEAITLPPLPTAWMQSVINSAGTPLCSFQSPPGTGETPPSLWFASPDQPIPLPGRAPFLASNGGDLVLTGDFTEGLQLVKLAPTPTVAWEDRRPLYSLSALALSQSGTYAAAAHGSPTGLSQIHVVSTASQSQFTLTDCSGTIRSLAMSGDQWLAAGGDDRVIRLWKLQAPSRCHAQPGHARPIRVLAFSPDGSLLCSGDQGGRIAVSPLPSSRTEAVGPPVAATPDLSFLFATSHRDGQPQPELVIVATSDGSSHRHDMPGIPSAISLSGSTATVLCQDGRSIRRCRIPSGGPATPPDASAELPPGTQAAALTSDGFLSMEARTTNAITLRSHRFSTAEPVGSARLAMAPWSTVTMSPDGLHCYLLDAPAGQLACLAIPSLELKWQQSLRQSVAVAVSPDGATIAWAGGFHAGLLETSTGREISSFRQPCEIIARIAFAGPQHLMLSSYDHTLVFASLAAAAVTLESRRQPACAELLCSSDLARWLSIDLRNQLTWFPPPSRNLPP